MLSLEQSFYSDLDDDFDLESVFQLFDSLVDVSLDESSLNSSDLRSYLSDIAFQCEN